MVFASRGYGGLLVAGKLDPTKDGDHSKAGFGNLAARRVVNHRIAKLSYLEISHRGVVDVAFVEQLHLFRQASHLEIYRRYVPNAVAPPGENSAPAGKSGFSADHRNRADLFCGRVCRARNWPALSAAVRERVFLGF